MLIQLPVLGSYFKVKETDFVIPVGGNTQIVKPDASRWSIIIGNNSTPTMAYSTNANVAIGSGIPIPAPGFLELLFERHGALVQLGIVVQTLTAAAGFLTVIETFYQPPAGSP